MRDLNLEFLRLLVRCRYHSCAMAFGLDAAVHERLVRLAAEQLEAIAATPCLLAGLPEATDRPAQAAAEPRPEAGSPCVADRGVFIAGLLTYASQMVRRDPLRAALCAGPGLERAIAGLRFREIHAYARHTRPRLEARFCRHPRFWPELVAAAREGAFRRLELVRLSAIQLAVEEMAPSCGTRRLPSREQLLFLR
ncbi:MAG: hypothetical protein H3C57_01450 [Gammaproteobacteria bacterium]|nr:hypothetical protein [Gammaproteobacteria bacterium]